MPELPEVETLRRGLETCLVDRTVSGIRIQRPEVLLPEPPVYERELPGRRVEGLGRRGKYLIVELSGEKRLVVHLRMTGRLLWYENGLSQPAPHTHVILEFRGGGELHYQDVRRFGRWWLTNVAGLTAVPGLADLGPEPTAAGFSAALLAERLKHRGRAVIKGALLDQRVVAGLGNIYVDEALFAAGIHPLRTVGSLSGEDIERLSHACRQVLEEGISHRGTTFRDYVDALAVAGDNQAFLRVFRRQGQACFSCGREIRRIKVAGRSSCYCPGCQKEP